MIAKSVAVTVALVLVASASQAQMAPTNIDQAIYVTCRQAHAMNPEARKALAMGVPRQPSWPTLVKTKSPVWRREARSRLRSAAIRLSTTARSYAWHLR